MSPRRSCTPLIHPWSHLSLEFCLVVRCLLSTAFSPTAVLHHPSRLALSKVWMCDGDAAVAEPPADEGESSFDLDSISDDNKALMEKIGGMTLMDAAALIKEVESTFNVGPKSDDGEGEAIEE